MDYAQLGNYPECVELLAPVTTVRYSEQCTFIVTTGTFENSPCATAIEYDAKSINPTLAHGVYACLKQLCIEVLALITMIKLFL